MTPPTNDPTPGHILRTRFRAPLGMNAEQLSDATGLSTSLIEGVLAGTVRVDDEIAACLGDFLGTDARLWLQLQQNADRSLLTA